jgi:hypothetical protein
LFFYSLAISSISISLGSVASYCVLLEVYYLGFFSFLFFFNISCASTLRFAHLVDQVSLPLLCDLFIKQLSPKDVYWVVGLLCNVGFVYQNVVSL